MKSPLSSPFTSDPFASKEPSPTSPPSAYLCCDIPQLEKPEDTSVLKTVFYCDSPALKYSKSALDSPQGTGIVDPKSLPKKV